MSVLDRLLAYKRRWGVVRNTTWKSSGSISGLTTHDPRFGGTYTKIDAELQIDENAITVDRAYLQIRQQNVPSSAFIVRDCIIQRIAAAQQAQYGTQSAIYGIVPYMTPGITYEGLMWVSVSGLWIRHYMGTVTMKSENITELINPVTLENDQVTPTKYVATGGTDTGSSSGGTLGAPWANTEQAIGFLASGGICRFGPGFYGPAQVDRTASGTFFAQYPVRDANGNIINQGLHSVIEPITVTAPTGTTAHTPGNADYSIGSSNPYTVAPWVAVALQGTGQTLPGGTLASPTTPQWHGGSDAENPDGTIWKLSNVPAIDAQALAQVGYCANRADIVSKIGHTRNDTAVLDSPGGWAEILDTNLDYNDSGAFLFGTDLYVRLPSHSRRADGQLSRNPNDFWMKIGGDDHGFDIDGNNIRINGFHVQTQQFGVQIHNPRSGVIIDRNVFSCFGGGVRCGHGSVSTNGAQSFTGYNNNNTIQENSFFELTFWRENADGIPWRVCKEVVTLANGLVYNSSNGYTGALVRWTQMENTGVTARGGGVRNTSRRNIFDGPFNGYTAMGFSTSEGRYAGYGCESYENQYLHLVDDTWELDQNVCNVGIWKETVEQALVGLSLGPCDFGPIYLWECAVYLGRDGIAKRNRDTSIDDSDLSCTLVKHSGGSLPRATAFLSNITLAGNQLGVWGPGELASPTGSNEEAMNILNCIYVITGRCILRTSTQPYEVDYSVMVSNNLAGQGSYGISWNGTNYTDDIPAFRVASGQFAHGNIVDGQEVGGFDYDQMAAHLRDPWNSTNRDLRLLPTSYSKFVGVNIPGWTREGGFISMGYEPYGEVA